MSRWIARTVIAALAWLLLVPASVFGQWSQYGLQFVNEFGQSSGVQTPEMLQIANLGYAGEGYFEGVANEKGTLELFVLAEPDGTFGELVETYVEVEGMVQAGCGGFSSGGDCPVDALVQVRAGDSIRFGLDSTGLIFSSGAEARFVFIAFYPDDGDCDDDGVLDALAIASGSVSDVNGNGLPDPCEPDCDADGLPDAFAAEQGLVADCNGNRLPDSCETGLFDDCDGNGVPDECQANCNGSGLPDVCEIASGIASDCDGDGVPDSCQINAQPSLDCDGDGVLDSCEALVDPRLDCDLDGVLDACEIGVDPGLDCNGDGVLDACQAPVVDCNQNGVEDCVDLAAGTSFDCNQNGVPDECDLDGLSADANGDGIPDECAETGLVLKSLQSEVSLSRGGSATLSVDTNGFPSKTFLVLGTTSGFAPGLALGGGLHLPLNASPYFDQSLLSPNGPPLSNSFSFVGLFGQSAATFTLPPGSPPGLAGTVVHHAFVLFDFDSAGGGSGAILGISNPAGFLLAP